MSIKLSIIIPVYNEKINIENSIPIIAGNMKISPARITKKNPKKGNF